MRAVIEKQPAMGVALSGTVDRPMWARLREIDLMRVVEFVKTRDVRRILEEGHQVGFTWGGLPLWRVKVISSAEDEREGEIEVAFFVHHALGDGRSGFAFHLDFVDALNNLAAIDNDTQKETSTLVKVPKLDFLPPLEDAHTLPLSYRFIATQLIKSLLPASKDNQHWTGSPHRSDRNITNFRLLYLPSSILNNLLRQCRHRNVTFTALLTVTIARVLARVYTQYTRFSCSCAMSFRRFTATGRRAMCNYVTSYTHRFSSVSSQGGCIPCDTFSWDAVQTCFKEIKSATASPANQQVGLLKFVNNYEGFFKDKVGRERPHSFEISNVGVFEPERPLGRDDGEVKVDRILFSQSSNVVSGALVFSVASAKEGELGIGLTWQEDIVKVDDAEKVLGGIDGELRKLAAESGDNV